MAGLIVGFHGLEHLIRHAVGHLGPDGDDLVVAFAVGDDAILVLLFDLDHFFFRFLYQAGLALRNHEIVNADRDSGLGRIKETERLDFIQQLNGCLKSKSQVAIVAKRSEPLLAEQTVNERHTRGQVIIEDDPAHGGVDELVLYCDRFRMQNVLVVIRGGEINNAARVAQPYRRQSLNLTRLKRQRDLFSVGERSALPLGSWLGPRQVIHAQHDVLRGDGQRSAIGRRENVPRRKHEHRSLNLRLGRERNMDRHLVTVKVRVECGTDQWVDLDGFTFHQYGLEGLDTKPVQSGSAV